MNSFRIKVLEILLLCLSVGWLCNASAPAYADQTRPLYATGDNLKRYYRGTVNQIQSVSGPIAPTYDSRGNLYVINSLANGTGGMSLGSAIIRIAPDGSMRTLTSAVPGASWLTCDRSDNLWVSSSGTGSSTRPLYKVTLAGEVSTFATIPANSQAVACDAVGNVYVKTAGTVYKVLSSGIVTTLGTFPDTNNLGNVGYGLIIDSNNNVYVPGVEVGNNTTTYPLYKLTPDGTRTTFVSLPSFVHGLTIDGANNIYAYVRNPQGNTFAPAVLKITPAGVQSVFANVPGPYAGAWDPEGLAYNGQDSVVVGNLASGSVQKLKADNSVSTLALGLGKTTGIVHNGYGTLYVVDNTNKRVVTLGPDGSIKQFASLPNAGSLQGMARDAAGNLYIADITNNLIDRVSPAGAVSIFLSGLAAPQSVAFDSMGDFYILSSSQIVRTNPDGSNPTLFASNLTNAYDIAFDLSDNAFVSTTTGTLNRITQAGVSSVYSSQSGNGLALDNNGDLYIATTTKVFLIPVTLSMSAVAGSTGANYLAIGQGVPNLMLQNTNTNQIALWNMATTTVLSGAFLSATPAAGYKIVGTGDFNHDGTPDIVFQNQTTNQIAVWYLQGNVVTGGELVTAQVGLDYKVVGVGDFNGDNNPDLVFQSQSTGAIVLWYMNGATFIGGAALPYTVAAGWSIVAVGDMDGDSNPDFVFQNQTSGQIVFWYMQNTVLKGGVSLNASPGSGWKVQGLGYIGAGVQNLIFQNQSSGQIAFWYMQNITYTGGGQVNVNPGTQWRVTNTH